ncbi:MAG: YceI family protein [Acidimicrobiales bacterium]
MGFVRRHLRWVVGAVAAVVALAVGGPYVFIHFVEGTAPAKLTLPAEASATTVPANPGGSSSSAASATSGASVTGTWNVGPGSVAGYRVGEILLGQHTTAVGRTSKVWGSLTITSTSVTSASFGVDMASVVSDQSARNAQFRGRIMDTAAYPTATFKLTTPIALGSIPAVGVVRSYPTTGLLDMHGVSAPVSFTLSGERTSTSLEILADIPITFATWHIANPSIAGLVTTQSSGTLEVLLVMTKGAGNPVVTGSAATSNGGGGSPITVPATTVPPLTVPAG